MKSQKMSHILERRHLHLKFGYSGLEFGVGGQRAPSVFELNAKRGPPAVFRAVSRIEVHAVEGCSNRSPAHVRKETLEGVSPSVAHHYSASSIVFEVWIFRIMAPLFDVRPRVIFWSSGKPVLHGFSGFVKEASAASGVSASHAPANYSAYFTAFATTLPCRLVPLVSANISNCGQPAELHSLNVFNVHSL